MRTHVEAQDEVNKRVYHAKGVERAYTSFELDRAEVLALLKYQSAFAGRDVLDLGVGTGRTTIYLAPLARRYEAIDYSPIMVDRMRARLPKISVRLSDFRDLSAFADNSFDFVFGSNNVLDAVSHEDRKRAFLELHRVLRPDGVLMFSSHNREYRRAINGPRITFSKNPVTQGVNLVRWARQLVNHARLARLRRFEADFALLNDEGHDYACLHYYIDQSKQREQLRTVGFRVIDVFDREGNLLPDRQLVGESPWLIYVAKLEEGTQATASPR
jgi:SAM-dependent methyltransferase